MCLIYIPVAAVGYMVNGSKAESSIFLNLADGPVKVIVEIMIMLHLITAFPIITNPPAQYFEQVLKIPSGTVLPSRAKPACFTIESGQNQLFGVGLTGSVHLRSVVKRPMLTCRWRHEVRWLISSIHLQVHLSFFSTHLRRTEQASPPPKNWFGHEPIVPKCTIFETILHLDAQISTGEGWSSGA